MRTPANECKHVILLEPNLHSQEGGHYYQNIKVIQEELQAKDVETMIVGCQGSDATCQELPMFRPAFKHLRTTGTGAFAKLVSLITLSWKFYRDLSKIFGSCSYIPLKPNDVLYMNTVLDTQILGWGLLLRRHATAFRQQGLRFIFLLKFRPTRRSHLHTAVIKTFLWLSFKRLMHALRDQVVFFTENEILKKEYTDLLHLPIMILPLPIHLQGIEERSSNVSPPLTITYLGRNVPYKGFDLVVGAIELLDEVQRGQHRFKLQIHLTHNQSGTTEKRLKRLMQTTDTIELVPEFLTSRQYGNLFNETNILVLPYRSIHYKASTSGVFAEALTTGKIPVVPKDTWMGEELVRFKLEELTFKQEDSLDLARVLSHVIENHLHYREMMLHVAKIWQSQHNPRAFVEALLRQINGESSLAYDHETLAANVA